jgi:hypothetical protein
MARATRVMVMATTRAMATAARALATEMKMAKVARTMEMVAPGVAVRRIFGDRATYRQEIVSV